MSTAQPNISMGEDGGVHAAGALLFTYNIVFSCRGKTGLPTNAFCTVKMDMAIEYGSDLEALRKYLSAGLELKDLVIVSWHLLKDSHRPDEALPKIELTR